jgi:hypothetical protein
MNTIKAVLLALVASVALAAPTAAHCEGPHHHGHGKGHKSNRHDGGPAVADNKAVGSSASASSLTATASKALGVGEAYEYAGWALRHRYGGHWTNAEYRYLRAWVRIGNRIRFRYSYYGATESAYGFVTVWKVPAYGDPRFVYSFSAYHGGGGE